MQAQRAVVLSAWLVFQTSNGIFGSTSSSSLQPLLGWHQCIFAIILSMGTQNTLPIPCDFAFASGRPASISGLKAMCPKVATLHPAIMIYPCCIYSPMRAPSRKIHTVDFLPMLSPRDICALWFFLVEFFFFSVSTPKRPIMNQLLVVKSLSTKGERRKGLGQCEKYLF